MTGGTLSNAATSASLSPGIYLATEGCDELATLVHDHAIWGGESSWETGDRLSISRTADPRRFRLADDFSSGEFPISRILSPDGAWLDWSFDRTTAELIIDGLETSSVDSLSPAHLECIAAGQFRIFVEPLDDMLADAERVTDGGVRIAIRGNDDARRLLGTVCGRPGLRDFQLAAQAARLGTFGSFDQLICLPLVREMELLEHQIRTARTVLRRFRGRAMLCDEVGLGKTIEAGLILSELCTRGLARSVLVLTPPSLIEQWHGELLRKFSLDFVTHDAPEFRELGAAAWSRFDRVLVSTHTAKREPHRSAILKRRWDLVIVDEAHHLRNRTTQLWRFASQLDKQYILLLTATPVQNNLDELFNLVTLLEPGLLRTAKQFQTRFVDRNDKLTPKNVEELHELLAEVMIRNRRSTVGLQFTRRWATTLSVPPSPAEADLYRQVTVLVKEGLVKKRPVKEPLNFTPLDFTPLDSTQDGQTTSGPPPDEPPIEVMQGQSQRAAIPRIALLSLQMALGSSSQAAAGTLTNMSENDHLDAGLRDQLVRLAAEARSLPPGSKVERLLELLRGFSDKMVVFTQFRATQTMLAERLAAEGFLLAVFHGGLTRLEKEAAIREFRGPAQILLCTEAGSEGRNLQFAHAICNFDLPWNPMKIEQRIGRLSRIGQSHDVLVYNLVAAGTVEAAVLHLLDAKLSMFELVIGEIDMILGNLEEELEFQDVVADLWVESDDGADFARRMERLGDRLLAAKRAYLEQRAHDDRLFGSRFSPEA